MGRHGIWLTESIVLNATQLESDSLLVLVQTQRNGAKSKNMIGAVVPTIKSNASHVEDHFIGEEAFVILNVLLVVARKQEDI